MTTSSGDLSSMLAAAVRRGASDVHLSVGAPPLMRLSGSIVELEGFPALDADSCRRLVYSALLEEHRARFEERLDLDCSFMVPGVGRFRMSVLLQRGGVEAVLRVIPSVIPTPESLGLSPAVMRLADLSRGLVLVTGPTGSGKTSTVACMVESINQRRRKHILTIEDPIEFVYQRRLSVIRQREVGPHTRSFRDALRHGLRQDPDVILVGELRDLETISLALTAAETGHLCLSTLHTQGAAETVHRIIDVFPPEQQAQVRTQLATTLKAVISQVLLPRKGGRGMVAARELLIVTPGAANLIREGNTHMLPSVMETGGDLGMQTLSRSVLDLARRGLVDAAYAGAHIVRQTSAPGLCREAVRPSFS